MFGTRLKTWKDVFYTHVIFGWIVPLIFVHVFHWCDFTVWFCFDILFGNALEMWCAVGCIWAVRECMKITFIRSVKQAFINSYVPTGNRCCHTWLLCVLFCFFTWLLHVFLLCTRLTCCHEYSKGCYRTYCFVFKMIRNSTVSAVVTSEIYFVMMSLCFLFFAPKNDSLLCE